MLIEIVIRGRPYIVDVYGGENIAELRRRLVRDEGIPENAVFTVNGRVLADADVLAPHRGVPTTPAALLEQYAAAPANDPLGGISLLRVSVA